MTPAIEIRLLFESDIPSAMRLKEAAGWNQTEADWRRLLSLQPDGCFGAVSDGELVGTTTTTIYGELAWIGMVLVAPERRRQGIASRLMSVALDYLKRRVATIKLDATALGRPVYEQFGFAVESQLERWSGRANSPGRETGAVIDAHAIRELLKLDRVAFNADRSNLIERLVIDSCISPVLLRAADGALSGYALARTGTRKTYIGPLVVSEPQLIATLLDEILSQLLGDQVYIDINRECVADTSLLSDRGFVKERDLIRMVKGPSQKTSPLVVAIAGPEIG
jgi:GNAT superfamily N-acetyltransferase